MVSAERAVGKRLRAASASRLAAGPSPVLVSVGRARPAGWRVEPHRHCLRARTPWEVSAGVRSNGDLDTAAPRWSSVARGTTLVRSKRLNVSRSAATITSGIASDNPVAGETASVPSVSAIEWILPPRSASKISCRERTATWWTAPAYRSFRALSGSSVAVISSFALTYVYSLMAGTSDGGGTVTVSRSSRFDRSNSWSWLTGNASGYTEFDRTMPTYS